MKKPACPKEQDGNQNGSHEWGGSENTEPVVEAEVKVKVAQWCLTLCDPMGCTVHGILQGRILEWMKVKSLSCVQLFATPWTVAYQATLSMGFSRQEYWSGLPFHSPDPPNPGTEPGSPTLQADALPSELPGKSTGLGSLSLLQRIFPTQGSNPGLLHYRWILYQLSHEESPVEANKMQTAAS